MSGEAGRRDEPDDRKRCPTCLLLGEPISTYERERTGKTHRCPPPCATYFGAEPHNQGEPE